MCPIFFLRGFHLILTGGGWIATVEQPVHWILLIIEIFISGFATSACFFLFYNKKYGFNNKILRKTASIKIIIFVIIFTFFIHFIRVGFWLQNAIL